MQNRNVAIINRGTPRNPVIMTLELVLTPEKLFFSHRNAFPPSKKSFSLMGTGSRRPKRVFQLRVPVPQAEKEFFGHGNAFPALKKSFSPVGTGSRL